MKWFLGIDTSGIELSIGLAADTAPAVSFTRYRKSAHAEDIADSVRFVLSSARIAPDDLCGIGIAVGPGSFTGLRVGIAFVKGFTVFSTLPVLPVSSLSATARAVAPPHSSCLVAFDARQDRVFWARFHRDDTVLQRMCDDRCTDVDSFVTALDRDETVVYDTLGNAKSPLPRLCQTHRNVCDMTTHPLQRGTACALCAAQEPSQSPHWRQSSTLVPRYIAASYVREKNATS
jgi:tRNA threonylcarbamoyladenosine biosynthesis protein TsaB